MTWQDALLYRETKTGRVLRAVGANIVTILGNHEAWAGVLAYDAFAETVIATRPPPWDRDDAPERVRAGDWTDEDTTRAQAWLARHLEIDVAIRAVHEAVAVVAARREVHPVRDWLRGLEWDGVARCDSWLSSCLGAVDTPYTRAVGAKFLIAAVARVECPGCKFDSVPILEGAQGIGKSTALRALAGDEWFLEFQGTLDGKDALQQLRRKWIAEWAELDALSRAELSRAKAFITTRVDTFRESYGRRARDHQRQVVFAATTNAERYLRDETGGRRFWPVRCGRVDLSRLSRERAQLWAEARVRFERGEPWYVADTALVDAFEREQEDRFQVDAWEPLVATWLSPETDEGSRRRLDGVTAADVLMGACGVPKANLDPRVTGRVVAILHRLGWAQASQRRRDGERIRPYLPTTPKPSRTPATTAGVTETVTNGVTPASRGADAVPSNTSHPSHPYAGAPVCARAHPESVGDGGVTRDGVTGDAPFADWVEREGLQ